MLSKQDTIPASTWQAFTERFQSDATFRELVRQDPRKALSSAGIPVPAGIELRYAGDAGSALSLVLAPAADHHELTDDELADVVGGHAHMASAQAIYEFLSILDRRYP